MIRVDPKVYWFYALLVLTIPFPWLVGAIAAAIVHELFHIGMILLLKGEVHGIRLGIFGARIHAQLPNQKAQLLASAAGPLGSFCMLLFGPVWPEAALCGFIQGVFNLLPIYPLDGGRMLRLIAASFFPEKEKKIIVWAEFITCGCILMAAYDLGIGSVLGEILCFGAGILAVHLICRKRLAKRVKSGYNSATIDKEVTL